MEFNKFPSLTDVSKQRTLFAIVEQKIEGPWIVTEKIDGANFCFYTDGVRVEVASRTQFVAGDFFSCQAVVERYAEKVKQLYKAAYAEFGVTGVLRVYGELYGPNINGRINYGEKDFVAFDLVYGVASQGIAMPCNKVDVKPICEEFGIPSVPVLGIYDTLDEALKVENSFKSFLTPEGHEGDNFAEGVVIEPCKAQWFANGSRVYLKNRAPEFMETANIKRSVPKEAVVLPEHVQEVVSEMLAYLTENRVYNVVSKIGEVGEKDFGKLLALTVQDAKEDYEKDKGTPFVEIVGSAEKLVSKLIAKEATLPVRKVFMEQLAA